MQAHGAGTPALRLPHQERRRIPRVIQIPPFQLKDLGDPQASAPHDERSGPGPDAGCEPPARREDAGPGRPSSSEEHPWWQNTTRPTLPKAAACHQFRQASWTHALERQKWQTLSQTLPPATPQLCLAQIPYLTSRPQPPKLKNRPQPLRDCPGTTSCAMDKRGHSIR